MKFVANTKTILEILKKMDVKGELSEDIIIKGEENGILFLNGNAITVVSHALEIETEGESGRYNLDSRELIKFLSKINGEIIFDFDAIDGCLTLFDNENVFSIPLFDTHGFPQSFYDNNIKNINSEMTLENLNELTNPELKYEGKFTISYDNFSKALDMCNIVNEIIVLNLKEENVTFHSQRGMRSASLVFEHENFLGEEACVSFSGRIESFFKGEENLTFFVRDDFPLLIVSENCKLMRAPRVENE